MNTSRSLPWGEDDPSGDEKSFALTRQCRCIPIVATQSISSLRSVLGSSEAWRTLLQTLRTRIFLSLSDDASAQIASALCGQVAKIKPSYTITESAKQSEVSMLSAQAGGGQGSVGASKSFREQREAVFQPREFALLSNCEAICLPYDGARSLPATRVYLKPHYLPRTLPYCAGEGRGETMSDSLELLKPFLPGLEDVLEDPEVSEIMINGPHNVWIERHGKLYSHEAPLLTASALNRAAIHIARPLGLDPATAPIVDARLEDGSRVAICVPPASPKVAITVRRFGKRAFSAADLVEQGALPENVRSEAERVLYSRRNILVSGGTGSGKTTLLNALIELLPDDERIVAIEDTLELRIEHSNCVRFEARGLANRSRDDPGPGAPRLGVTARITSWWARCAVGRRRTCCRPSTPDTAARSPPCTPTTPRAPCRVSPVAPCRAAGSFPGRSPVGAWWTALRW